MSKQHMLRTACLLAATSILSAQDASASTQHYFYDARGRYIGVTSNPNEVRLINLDTADNRVSWFGSYFAPRTSSQQLSNYQVLTQGDTLVSGDGRFTCVLQEDGNLVVYQGSVPLWSTNTSARNAAYFNMLGTGNLILTDIQGATLWQSYTDGYSGARVIMQSDGNLVLRDANDVPRWSSGTGGH